MTYDDLLKKYRKNISELQRHLQRINGAFGRLKETASLPLDAQEVSRLLSDDMMLPILDQIVYRFSKIQDSLGRTLRLYLSIKGEDVDNLAMIDVINLAQKLGLEIDPEKWFRLRELRNIISHEYEDEQEEIAKVLNVIYSELDSLQNLISELMKI